MVKASLDQRFWAKVDRRGDGECWPWTARTGGPGYGYIDDRPAHRVAYELTIGPIPLGLVIDHLCRNRICVNPQHLEVVTPRTNVLRGIGPAAINAASTHCKRGHGFTPSNTILRPQPSGRQGRLCRTCRQDYDRDYHRTWRAARRAAAASAVAP